MLVKTKLHIFMLYFLNRSNNKRGFSSEPFNGRYKLNRKQKLELINKILLAFHNEVGNYLHFVHGGIVMFYSILLFFVCCFRFCFM